MAQIDLLHAAGCMRYRKFIGIHVGCGFTKGGDMRKKVLH